MMHKAQVALCSEILTKKLNAKRHYVEFLDVKPGGT